MLTSILTDNLSAGCISANACPHAKHTGCVQWDLTGMQIELMVLPQGTGGVTPGCYSAAVTDQ